MPTHHFHPEVLQRLKRANGHLAKIIRMIEAQEPCLSVAQQLQAVASAVNNAKTEFVRDHIEHCLDEFQLSDPRQAKEYLDEFKEITKYL